MRKALILLVVFAMVGAAAFAEGATPKWSITTKYGLGIVSSDGEMSSVPFDWAHEGTGRTRLGFTYTAADGNAGFNSRLQMVGSTSTASFNQLNGWAKLFDGMLTVRAGKLDDYTIATKDWWCYGNTDGAFGMYFNVSPMAGLDIGYFQPIPSAAQTGGKTFVGSVIGAAYNIADIGSLQAGAIVGGSATAAAKTGIYAGFSLSAVKDLTAILEAKVTLADPDALIALNQNIAYAMGALTVGARIGEYLNGSDFDWGIEPTVGYKVNDNLSVNAIVNVYSSPMNDNLIWTSGALYAGVIGAGAAGDVNFGAGASVSWAADGFKLTDRKSVV